VSFNTSCLEAPAGFLRLLKKGIIDLLERKLYDLFLVFTPSSDVILIIDTVLLQK
jgi:hypothetical protein